MFLIQFIKISIFFGLITAFPISLSSDNVQITKKSLQWDYSSDKIQGVNLGGWFVLEPYITPSLFDIWSLPNNDTLVPVDEYHYTEKLGKSLAKQRLETHWDTWYNESDFKLMAEYGLNFVRIPIGYWAFVLKDDDPYVQGQLPYLNRALKWCKKYGIKAWIDLHGAAGSQNGFDNSGLRDSYEFQNGNNTNVTIQAINTISDLYMTDDDVVIGVELLNEPLGSVLDMDKLKAYYQQGYDYIRQTNDQAVIIHDAFKDFGYWDDFFTLDTAWNVVVDHHHYQVFSGTELNRNISEHVSTVCSWGQSAMVEGHWNVCGEWSAALTDCARWLNGVGKGARWSGDYDGVSYIDSCDAYTEVANWSDDYRTNVRKYIESQLDAFNQTGGWVFWNWKCEDAIEWDFKQLIVAEIFPLPFDDRKYPNQCDFS